MRNNISACLWLALVIVATGCKPKSSPPYELSQHNKNMLAYYANLEFQATGQYVTFWGDSFIQSLLVQNICPNAINLGIGTQTSYGLLQQITQSPQLISHSQYIVISIGVNDLKHQISAQQTINNIEKSINHIRTLTQAPILLNNVFLVDELKVRQTYFKNTKINQINQLMNEKFSDKSDIILISVDEFQTDKQLNRNLHRGDGLHLNAHGYRLWTETLKKHIQNCYRVSDE